MGIEHTKEQSSAEERSTPGKAIGLTSPISTKPIWRNRVLLAVSFAIFIDFAGTGMVAPVRILYATEHGASLAVVDAMATAYLVSNFIFQFPAGWLADRWGHKRIMLLSLLAQGILSAIYIPVTDPYVFIGLRFLEGMFGAALMPATRALIIDAIPENQQGQAFGIFAAFFNAGFLLGPGLGGLLGETWAFGGAVITRVLAIMIILIWLGASLKKNTNALQSGGPSLPTTSRERTSFKDLLALPLLGAYIIAFGDYLYLGFDQTLMPIWLHNDLGASMAIIGLIYVVWSIPNTLLGPIGGRVADRVSRKWLILLFGLGQIPLYIGYGLANNVNQVLTLFALHGILYAFMIPAMDSFIASSSPGKLRARVQGLYTTTGFIGAFVGSSGFTPLYHISFRLPPFAMGAGYGLCIIVGSTLIFLAARRAKS
ncbi:MFS transporter [Ktedonospora formicarum]|uniref:MFS transporter n=1 Tax=Ktedonospora formicarum TaxID=2778364 RepID=A0A8J3HZK4_9CHLR|nr:MFS transporter [Ktedonospora formicarum]GHO43898.1 MFS transporter [Ktedonospora formicarum]